MHRTNFDVLGLQLHGEAQRADDLRKVNKRAEICPCNQAIMSCAKETSWTLAAKIFHELRQLNLQGTAGTYSTMVNAFGKAKMWQKALQMWAACHQIRFLRANVVLHGAAMSSLEKMGKWHQVLSMLADLQPARLQSNIITASTAISSCVRGRRVPSESNCLSATLATEEFPTNVILLMGWGIIVREKHSCRQKDPFEETLKWGGVTSSCLEEV